MSVSRNVNIKHGKHLFVFCQISTKQVIYSLRPVLKDSDIKQLPFIGKKSVPATIRPDLWEPLCAVTFPSPQQGLSAFKKLRELRRLHELCWDPKDPEFAKATRKERIKKIMDQKANSVADLAKVLEMQKEGGKAQEEYIKKREEMVERIANKKWAEIEAAAKSADEGEVKRIEANLETLKQQYERRQEKEKERITKAIKLLRARRQKLLLAQERIRRRDKAERVVQAKKAAIEAAKATSGAGENPAEQQGEILENPYYKHVLVKSLRKKVSRPYVLDGIVIEWKDEADAYYAKEWPEEVEHDTMGPTKRLPILPGQKRNTWPLTEEENERMKEVALDGESEAEAEAEDEKGEGEDKDKGKESDKFEEEQKKEEKKGLLSRLFSWNRKSALERRV